MTALLGPAELKPLVEAVIATHPDAVNPTNVHGDCLYTAKGNPDHRCLIGQLAADQGWEVPGPTVKAGASSAARAYGWPVTDDGADWLTCVQVEADIATHRGLPWSSITLPEVP